MSNVLDIVSKDNTRFTIFENDQVLTADQLNDLFNYLDVQTRLTRTKTIGVGIVYGLEIGVLANNRVVVSKGAAITTDGDLLYFDADQQFDQYQLFEDVNAKYPYFRNNSEQVITMYELLSSSTAGTGPLALTGFEQATATPMKDYVGILYLEDYENDADVCTGTDCDNKGILASKELKVLLVHKLSVNTLLQSIPAVNTNYFALDDMAVPRVIIKNSLSTYAELNAAFNAVASSTLKEEIKNKLGTAYQFCRNMIDDQFDGGDPTSEWNTLLDGYFNLSNTIYAQYLYDFERDISYAYNELRETLFTANMLSSPGVQLFPKHVLMGLVKEAAISTPQSPPVSPANGNVFTNSTVLIRFDISSLIKRFHPVHIDIDYRHPFYESPVLNNRGENIEKTRFCFMRIHSLIHNFKVPSSTDLSSVAGGIKITPGYFEDKPLGDRSIPFYYAINNTLPANLYWSYEANIRVKENEILSYWSSRYATKTSVVSPLQFNLFPYNFFRIEGHIGFNHSEVERSLNQIISDNNLPINIVTVQVEKILETIPGRPWFFPHLQVYDTFVRNTFLDHMNQVELVHNDLKTKTTDADVSINQFSIAKENVLANNKPVTDPEFDVVKFKAAASSAISAATDVKFQTKQFTFSNTATPHDFVINTDLLHKVDNLSDLLVKNITIKKQGLMLGNFVQQNPGLDHAGGVLSGGTFVLVYTSNDNIVVADFMLPYASIDKDIVPNPPVFKPLEVIPKLDLPKVLEIVPHYVDEIEKRIVPFAKTADLDSLVNAKVDAKIITVNTILDSKLANQDQIIDSKLNSRDTIIDKISKTNSDLFDKVLSGKIVKPNVLDPNLGNVLISGTDFSTQLQDLHDKQKELEALPADSPDRKAKETALLDTAKTLADNLNKPEILADPDNAMVVKSVLSDIHSGISLIQTKTLRTQGTKVTDLANNINIRFIR